MISQSVRAAATASLALVLVLAGAASATRALAADFYGTNLVVNGNADAGTGAASNSEIKPPKGWKTTGEFTAVRYGASGGFPDKNTPGPDDRGTNFFAGGNVPISTGTQTISLAPGAADIDKTTVKYTFSAWLGGYGSQDDNATATVTFVSASGSVLSHATLLPVLAAERSNATSFLQRTQSGTVPKDARSAVIKLTMTRVSGTYNDGEADDVSLILTNSP